MKKILVFYIIIQNQQLSFMRKKTKKRTIVLYKDETGFRHAFYSNKLEYWDHSGNVDLLPKDGFNWTMINDSKIPIAILPG